MQDRDAPTIDRIVLVLLAAHVALAAIAMTSLRGPVRDPDVLRFHELASAPGAPWRDREVEYAPGEVLFIEAIGWGSAVTTGRLLVVGVLAADLAIAWMLAHAWGGAAMRRYLVLSLPVLPLLLLRFDLVATALAFAGLWLAKRGSQRASGLVLGAAALSKLWPAALLPALWWGERKRALRWASASIAAGLAAWVFYGGFAGPRQVMSFRGATGWGVESTVGVWVWVLGGGSVRIEQGAPRIGEVPDVVRPVLAVVLVAALGVTWWRARRWDGDQAGSPSVAAIAVICLLSPLFSLQYAAWLLPFAAVASLEPASRWVWRSAAAVVVLTGILHVVAATSGAGAEQVTIVMRSVALLAVPVAWLVATRRDVSVSS